MDYVVGFLFDNVLSRVVLITKAKPAWQKGLLNGVGGKVEQDESPIDAMHREFREETKSPEKFKWSHFANLTGLDTKEDPFYIHFFAAKTFRTLPRNEHSEEKVDVYVVCSLQELPCVPNLQWLIPMALNHLRNDDRCQQFFVEEAIYEPGYFEDDSSRT